MKYFRTQIRITKDTLREKRKKMLHFYSMTKFQVYEKL